MASIQEPGTVEILAEKQSGQTVLLWRGSVGISAPAGGAPDAGFASVSTPEKRIGVARRGDVVIEVNDYLTVKFTAIGADGLDVSDCIWQIPITLPNGTVEFLSIGDFANPAPADYTAVAGIPVVVARWKADRRCQFGGSVFYLDMQDDTV